jgi:hypothetical protein
MDNGVRGGCHTDVHDDIDRHIASIEYFEKRDAHALTQKVRLLPLAW